MTDDLLTGLPAQFKAPVEEEAPSFGDLLSGDISTFNSTSQISGFLKNSLYKTSLKEEGFSPYDQPEFKGKEQYADSFTDVFNRKAFEAVNKQVDAESAYREIESKSPWYNVLAADIVTGISDPINWIPMTLGGKAIYGASKLGKYGKAAVATGVAGGVGASVNEAISQATLETRTAEESAVNIGASTLLGSVLGGGVALIKSRVTGINNLPDLANGIEKDLDGLVESRTFDDSVGAMRSEYAPLPDESKLVGSGKLAELTAKTPIVRNPVLNNMLSESGETRTITRELAEISLKTKGNEAGIASPIAVESKIKLWNAPMVDAFNFATDSFQKYRTGNAGLGVTAKIGVKDLASDLFRVPRKELNISEFKDEIGIALLNNDTHAIPEVAAAAKYFRARVYEPLKKAAIEAGMLPEDVTPSVSDSYFHTIYDHIAISRNRVDFERRIADHFEGKKANVVEYAKGVDTHLTKAKSELATHNGTLEKYKEETRTFGRLGQQKKTLENKKLVSEKRRAVLLEQEKLFRDTLKIEKGSLVAKVTPQLEEVVSIVKGKKDIREPISLIEFIKSKGGVAKTTEASGADLLGFTASKVYGDTGEVAALEIKRLVSKKGRGLDELGELAQGAGYFRERPDINELIEAITEEAGGNKLYRAVDADIVARIDEQSAYKELMEKYLDEAGVNLQMDSIEGIAKKIADFENANLKLSTGKNIGKLERSSQFSNMVKNRLKELDRQFVTREAELGAYEGKVRAASERQKFLQQEIADIKASRGKLEGRIKRMEGMLADNEQLRGMTRSELEEVAREITDSILGGSVARTGMDITSNRRGALNNITLNIPRNDILDFIEKDAFQVTHRIVKTMSSDIELTNKFGSPDMQIPIDRINADYAAQRKILEAKKDVTPKKLRALDARRIEDIRNIEGMRDRMRGTYAIPANYMAIASRAGRAAKTYNFVTKLGSTIYTQLGDLTGVVMTHGFQRTLGAAFKGLSRAPAYKLATKEVNLSGSALDTVLGTRIQASEELFSPYSKYSKFEKMLDKTGAHFGVLSLLSPWTDMMKHFAGYINIQRSMEAIEATVTGKISSKEKQRLARYGIDENGARQIWMQFQKYGKKEDGEYSANVNMWDNKITSDKFLTALGTETDRIIVTPGQEKPLWMSTELGSIVGQFKSFTLAANQRLLMSGLQEKDREVMEGIIAGVALGMMIYKIKVPPEQQSNDIGVLIKEGVDRSGLGGWLMEANNITEKLSGNNIGLSAMMGAAPSSRYSSRNTIGALLGPTFGTVSDALSVVPSITSGDMKAADAKAVRRMMPYQNHFLIKRLFDKFEEGLVSNFED